MLDRKVVRELLDEELKKMEIPKDIFKEALAETFCRHVEDDYYEWLKDNFKSFFKTVVQKMSEKTLYRDLQDLVDKGILK